MNKLNKTFMEEIKGINQNIILKESLDVNSIYTYPEESPYLIINHYILRSKNEYLQKIDNNKQKEGRYNIGMFELCNKYLNEHEDTLILDKL